MQAGREGMTYPGGRRPHIESALVLDVWLMDKLGAIRDGARGAWNWSRGDEQIASVSYAVDLQGDSGTLILSYRHTNRDSERESLNCEIRLSSVPLHYGGRRWYAHCPYTGRRARKLFKFASVAHFCHRTAIRPLPTYRSQRISGCDRVIAQRWLIRQRLGDEESDLFGKLCKPKRIRWHTFESFADRDAKLARIEDDHVRRLIQRR